MHKLCLIRANSKSTNVERPAHDGTTDVDTDLPRYLLYYTISAVHTSTDVSVDESLR